MSSSGSDGLATPNLEGNNAAPPHPPIEATATTTTTPHNNNTIVSSRGAQRLVPMTSYEQDLFAALMDMYHAETNPQGYIPLCVAENKLVTDVLQQRCLAKAGSAGFAHLEVYGYHNPLGLPILRDAMATFLTRRFLSRHNDDKHPCKTAIIEPHHVAISTGANSILNQSLHWLKPVTRF